MSDAKKEAEPAPDRRKKVRFPIAASFPLKVALALPDDTGEKWKDWSATLVDISATGAHVEVSMAAVAYPESRCRLKLSLGTFNLMVPGNIAHFICSSRLAVGGMQFYFPDPGVEKAYHRVLEPAIIGASLAPTDAAQTSVRYKEEFAGKLSSRLTIFREKQGAEISGFDFRLNRCGIEGERTPGAEPGAKLALKFKTGASDGSTGGVPLVFEADIQEARWLFRLAAGNFSAAVPAEIRRLLQSQG